MNYKIFPPERIVGDIDLPPSKSIANRLLMLQALCERPFAIYNLPDCDDVQCMRQALALQNLASINVGQAGTAMRFLTALFSLQEGHTITLDGSERMRERPIAPLVEALAQLGAKVQYAAREGYAPLVITGAKLKGTAIKMRGDVSSQFISAILLISPIIGGLELELEGEIVSRPYIDMTLALMTDFGIDAQWISEYAILVKAGHYVGYDCVIEGDWSAASYWCALQALLPQSQISLNNLHPDSMQGDCRMVQLLPQLGLKAHWSKHRLNLRTNSAMCCCCSIFADLNDMPDVAQTLVVLLCLLERPFRITGLHTLRMKETDRIEALRQEMKKMGYLLKIEGDDVIGWHFDKVEPEMFPSIDTHNDHRMAMAFAMAAVKFPGIIIENTEVVNKSYPLFWQHLRQCGFDIFEA